MKRQSIGLRLQMVAFAPLWLTYFLNVRPWFRSTSRQDANRWTAVPLMAMVISLLGFDTYLTLTGGDGSTLPKERVLPLVVFGGALGLLSLYFDKARVSSMASQIKEMRTPERASYLALGFALYAAAIADLFSKRPA